MNTKIYSITFAALILSAGSCKKTADTTSRQIIKAEWLIGSWENNNDMGNLSENWEKINDSVFHGTSHFIKGKDTLFSESVELTQKGADLMYSPQVKGQNNDLPVTFKMTSATANELTFENPAHDFPQKITYKRITKDSIVAEISGMQQGKPASETYPMARKK
jgi:hypothetical protein